MHAKLRDSTAQDKDEYGKQILREDDRLSSQIFPSLQLTVKQIIAAGK